MEDELRQVFRRQSPPPGFTERVMTRVRAEFPPKKSTAIRWATIGAIAASLTVGMYVRQQRGQTRLRHEAEIAEAQLIESLQIAGLKIGKAREAIFRPAKEIGE